MFVDCNLFVLFEHKCGVVMKIGFISEEFLPEFQTWSKIADQHIEQCLLLSNEDNIFVSEVHKDVKVFRKNPKNFYLLQNSDGGKSEAFTFWKRKDQLPEIAWQVFTGLEILSKNNIFFESLKLSDVLVPITDGVKTPSRHTHYPVLSKILVSSAKLSKKKMGKIVVFIHLLFCKGTQLIFTNFVAQLLEIPENRAYYIGMYFFVFAYFSTFNFWWVRHFANYWNRQRANS